MAGFNPADYVDVAERVGFFYEKHPEGSLQSEMTRLEDGWLCKAYAYRTPDDPRPGVGHAFEPIPGKTQFTRDSEAMNAETSAWGRAIVACGFKTKKIASADEVRNRQGGAQDAAAGSDTDSSTASEVDGLTADLLAAADKLGAKAATEEAVAESKGKRTPAEHTAWLERCLVTARKNIAELEKAK